MNRPIEEYKYTDNYAYGFEEGKVDGYKRGKADAIDECIDALDYCVTVSECQSALRELKEQNK